MRFIIALALGGCLDVPASVEVSGSGVMTGLQTQSTRCGGSSTVDRYLAGAGAVGITVFDGNHVAVYGDDAEVTGETDDSHELTGASGEWTLAVDPAGFAGQMKITLQCF